jgi:hypothetical protein
MIILFISLALLFCAFQILPVFILRYIVKLGDSFRRWVLKHEETKYTPFYSIMAVYLLVSIVLILTVMIFKISFSR